MSGVSLHAQESDKLRLSGSIQSDMLLAQKDSTTGAEATDGRSWTNTYLDLSYRVVMLRLVQDWSI